MEIRDHIRTAIIENLAPTLSAWGLKICRVEGYKCNPGRYAEFLRDRANLEVEKKEVALDKERIDMEHAMTIFKVEKAAERKRLEQDAEKKELEHKHALLTLTIQQEQWEKTTQHKGEVDRQYLERLKQIEIWNKAEEVQRAKQKAQFKLQQDSMRAQHEHDMERLQVLANLTPERILALEAAQSPQLAAALQAYADAQANQQQVKIITEFQERFQREQGLSQQKLQEIMQHALTHISSVAVAKMQASRPQVIPNVGTMGVIASSVGSDSSQPEKGGIAESGTLYCGHCRQVIPPPPPPDRRCKICGELLDSH